MEIKKIDLLKAKLFKEDKHILLKCCINMGKDEEWLVNGEKNDVSKWRCIKFVEQRMREMNWNQENLRGPIPDDFGKLSALTKLRPDKN